VLPVQPGKPQPVSIFLGNAKERLHQLLPNAGLDPPHHAEIIKMRVPSGLARLRDEDRRGKAMIKQLMQVGFSTGGLLFYDLYRLPLKLRNG